MNVHEAAEYLGVSVSTVRRWIESHNLPVLKLKLGGRLLFKKDALDEWLDMHMGYIPEPGTEYSKFKQMKVLRP
ncbi:helix-turn-helix domain-containing protein [Bacillus sp. FSL W7-1360]